jgi:hypothetical protein
MRPCLKDENRFMIVGPPQEYDLQQALNDAGYVKDSYDRLRTEKMDETFEIAWELMKSDGRSFRLNFGPKNLYLVIEYDDGKELFMQDYDSFLEEFRQAESMVDEDYLEMMYGVGSEYHGIAQHPEGMGKSDEKGDNAPTNPGLWSQAKSKARSKFKVYPSAYANGWAAKWYKSKGGGWKKKGKKEVKKSFDLIQKKSWDDLDDDEGWTDNDLQCRVCKYVQTPEEWEKKNCKMCGTRNTIHPSWR